MHFGGYNFSSCKLTVLIKNSLVKGSFSPFLKITLLIFTPPLFDPGGVKVGGVILQKAQSGGVTSFLPPHYPPIPPL